MSPLDIRLAFIDDTERDNLVEAKGAMTAFTGKLKTEHLDSRIVNGLGTVWERMDLAFDRLLDSNTAGIPLWMILPICYTSQRALLTYVCGGDISPSLIWPEAGVIREAFSQDLTPDEVATFRVLLALVMDTANVIRQRAIRRIEDGINFDAVFATASVADDDTVELTYELQATLHTAEDDTETVRLQWFPKVAIENDQDISHTTFVLSEGTLVSTTSGAVSVLERAVLEGSDFSEAAVPFILAACRDGWTTSTHAGGDDPAFFASVFPRNMVNSVRLTSLPDAESRLVTALASWSG